MISSIYISLIWHIKTKNIFVTLPIKCPSHLQFLLYYDSKSQWDFLFLVDVNEWINNNYAKCWLFQGVPQLNISVKPAYSAFTSVKRRESHLKSQYVNVASVYELQRIDSFGLVTSINPWALYGNWGDNVGFNFDKRATIGGLELV